ncbi:solute carrier family 25 (mitochondrial folate transporter), member 32 [Sporothrix brasiliensis 5110]|uniref:Solute carrier family 25 (Mitochondrial folate transporter), member 32 n=1 Tax=Sporothrix brasiliensis 5110 TaxID=1398154 RepID=A0A0C2J1A7_9PEZI|nr:solute carrier family 25 (mitochondrial folate transporter), member 32 [Sporothrix brasiliensis 5110]KIH90902.1 solute carrier family 25 (mitochondrial folate transporter), member 32 [Sporothrix brasiliensis 5110]
MTSAGDARHAGAAGPSSGLSPAFVEAMAGLTAGSTATLVVHPLDIVKTRMQIYSKTDAHGTAAVRPSTASVVRSLLDAPRPLAALYRGLAPNLLGNGASWAAFFFFKSRMETLLRATAAAPGHDLRAPHYFVASGLAGAGVQILTNPLWVLKTRMLSSDRHAAGAYPSMWVGARRVLAHEGWRGFYRGLGVSLIGVSHGAVQFAVYEPLKRFVRRGPQDGPSAVKASNESTLVVSSLAKLVAGAVTYPYQVVRSRLQNYNAEARFGRGIVGVSRQIWREDGARGFYRGLVPSVVRVMPATWVTFLVYENVKYYLPRWMA